MDNTEHVCRALGRFLAITSTARVYKELYGNDIPYKKLVNILNMLQETSDEYLYPKYIINKNTLLENFPSSEDEDYCNYKEPLDMNIAETNKNACCDDDWGVIPFDTMDDSNDVGC